MPNQQTGLYLKPLAPNINHICHLSLQSWNTDNLPSDNYYMFQSKIKIHGMRSYCTNEDRGQQRWNANIFLNLGHKVAISIVQVLDGH